MQAQKISSAVYLQVPLLKRDFLGGGKRPIHCSSGTLAVPHVEVGGRSSQPLHSLVSLLTIHFC